MAEQTETGNAAKPEFRMQKMYIKDLSFENPNAPKVFTDRMRRFRVYRIRLFAPDFRFAHARKLYNIRIPTYYTLFLLKCQYHLSKNFIKIQI